MDIWVVLLGPTLVRSLDGSPTLIESSNTTTQWEYGVALLYTGRLRAAADQFACCAALDRDDCEPWLWRFLVRGRAC